ncbi:hypothetical protein [Actinorugispora endophytica]|uniref:Uncharacterized protein n=1 Tax=Actinorugispora endophytica TaxID=1605990 RepID=A0A4R6V9D3_9ACTN|nr:hypothetical protein [Actinorugispora endophytica]TDQ55438.1 hypothetical protein EV190_101765 [Actinorugispora endophytica]
MNRMASNAAMTPLYAADLLRRYWAPLLCVYTAGTLLHDLLVHAMVWLSGVHRLLGMAGLSLAVLVTLAVTIIMFHLLAPGMPTLATELPGIGERAGVPFAERERRVVDAVTMAILPFLLFYSAWGMFAEEFRQYATSVANDRGLDAYLELSDIESAGLPLVVAIACWLGRTVFEGLYRRAGDRWLGLLTAVFEANWMFFAVFTVTRLVARAQEWLAGRVFMADLAFAVEGLLLTVEEVTRLPAVEAYAAALLVVAQLWEHLKEGLLEPLLWLTIVAVVFGAEVDEEQPMFGGGGRSPEQGPGGARGLLRGFGRLVGRDLRGKYTPFLNALRFVLRVGPVFFLSYCLYYVLLELGFGWLERGVYVLVGPQEFLAWWWQWLGPVGFVLDALHELARVCLLAAAFEMTLRRLGTRSVGRRARRAADRF